MIPLFALHGFAGSPASFDPLCERGFHVVAPSLAGHAPDRVEPRPFAAEVRRLAELARAAAPRVALLGYSMGGRLALGLLEQLAPHIAFAVVIGAELGLEPDERAKRLELDHARAASLRREGVHGFMDAWEAEPLFATQRTLPFATRERRRAERRAHDGPRLAAALELCSPGAMPDMRPAVAAFDAPIVFVAGTEDPKFAALAVEGAQLAPRGRALLVPGAGHDVLLEAPDAIAALLGQLGGAG